MLQPFTIFNPCRSLQWKALLLDELCQNLPGGKLNKDAQIVGEPPTLQVLQGRFAVKLRQGFQVHNTQPGDFCVSQLCSNFPQSSASLRSQNHFQEHSLEGPATNTINAATLLRLGEEGSAALQGSQSSNIMTSSPSIRSRMALFHSASILLNGVVRTTVATLAMGKICTRKRCI